MTKKQNLYRPVCLIIISHTVITILNNVMACGQFSCAALVRTLKGVTDESFILHLYGAGHSVL